ncbi:MAG: hypothetical protein OXB89_10650 [Anaerolineaceae bacterium]|nr:hypothetical protein [Anaerolineaceae bacterium]
MNEMSKFEVRVTGEHFSLEAIRPGKVTKLLNTLESFVIAIVKQENPKLDLTEDGALGFTSIESGSIVAGLTSPHEEVGRAWRKTGKKINSGDFADFPYETRELFREFVGFNLKYNTETEFWEYNGASNLLAVVRSDTTLPDTAIITGTTTLYGELLRIGGERTPTAQFRFAGSRPLTCQVKTTELAKEMAERLYKVVGVKGTGKWEAASKRLLAFRIDELTAYRETSITEAFESLRDISGKYYDEIDDVNAFITDLRGRGEDLE